MRPLDPVLCKALVDSPRWGRHVEVRMSGCREWVGALVDGYGNVKLGGTSVLAHRVALVAFLGHDLGDNQVDHLCRNTRCVEPTHLEAVPRSVNIGRSEAPVARRLRGEVTCKRGHDYEPTGSCRECIRQRNRIRACLEREVVRRTGLTQALVRSAYGLKLTSLLHVLRMLAVNPREVLAAEGIDWAEACDLVPMLSHK